ncbi:MAG: penicillin-binding protein 2 [Cyanobacteriota bacterium]|nr:penicillin-binding protein 2 [Cyanobacteriota bacterium]
MRLILPTHPSESSTAQRTEAAFYRMGRTVILIAITSLLLGILGIRLFFLQIIEGSNYQQLADQNRIRLIRVQPERGKILDRQGRVLASSRLSHSLFIWPLAQKFDQWSKILPQLSQWVGIPVADMQERLERAGHGSPYLVRLARDLDPQQVTTLMERAEGIPGVQVQAEPIRAYPYGDLWAHVLGYVGEINDVELERLQDQGYRLGDIVGKAGMESVLDPQLQGQLGGQQVEVDATGQVVKTLGEIPPQQGQDVRLTLDLDLQRAAQAALDNHNGAIVALDPRNGEVLAMVSNPGFDPNLFTKPITPEAWRTLQSRTYPFLNRALQGYPPASTFKVITTTAALESGLFQPDEILPTTAYIQVGGIRFWDWNRAGFGSLGFVRAMGLSSDTFFYQVAMKIGEQPIIQWSRQYGLGQKTGIELEREEAPGLIPDPIWKQNQLQEPWYIGDTINMSIGQGFWQATPLQLAVMLAVPANGGYRVRPHLILNAGELPQRISLKLQPETLRILQQSLRDVVVEGTGTVLNVADIPPVAGKSGTAEDFSRPSHAWFGAYAPAEQPEIVVVAFAENSGGGGGSIAAPMVLDVLRAKVCWGQC